MEKSLEKENYGRNGIKPFFSAFPNPTRRADFLFTRIEQVMFSDARNKFRTSKPLALAGGLVNTLRSRGLC